VIHELTIAQHTLLIHKVHVGHFSTHLSEIRLKVWTSKHASAE